MITKPIFSILHTSARPAKWRDIYEAWLGAADHPEDVEYVLCIDPRWGFPDPAHDPHPEFANMRAQDRLQVNRGRKCYVDGVNTAAQAATGNILIVNADDQYPCKHWDTILRHAIGKLPGLVVDPLIAPFGEFVLVANTGTPNERERGIVVMPIVSRARYGRLGYIFYPQYESMYADNDLCAHAKQDNCLFAVDAPGAIFPHRHPFFSDAAMDAAYEAQNRQEAYTLGAEIFERRKAAKFADVDAVTVEGTKPKFKHLAVCMPGREWPLEFMSTWTDLVMRMISTVPLNFTPIFGSASDPSVVRAMLAERVLKDLERPADYVLWIDNDNVLPFPYLLHMIKTLEERPEVSAVTGWCWLLHPAGGLSCGHIAPENGHMIRLDYHAMMAAADDLQEIEYTGFPAILMRREVIEMAGPNPFCPIVSDKFSFGKSGEDYAFCVRARAAGARFFVDRRLKVDHLKLGALDGEAMAAAASAAQAEQKQIPVPVETT